VGDRATSILLGLAGNVMQTGRRSICTARREGLGFPGYLTGLLTIMPIGKKKDNRIVHPLSPARVELRRSEYEMVRERI
jgi:hypothetical protein